MCLVLNGVWCLYVLLVRFVEPTVVGKKGILLLYEDGKTAYLLEKGERVMLAREGV